jgi:hypothetical protein
MPLGTVDQTKIVFSGLGTYLFPLAMFFLAFATQYAVSSDCYHSRNLALLLISSSICRNWTDSRDTILIIMNYKDGTKVQVGDEVTVSHGNGRSDQSGTVLQIIQPYSKEAIDWNIPEGGVLIEGGGYGLFVTNALAEDEDILFVCRSRC